MSSMSCMYFKPRRKKKSYFVFLPVPLAVSVLAPNLNPAIDLLRTDPLLLMNSLAMILLRPFK